MSPGLRIERRHTRAGQHPYDTLEWTRRDSRISNPDGSVVFEMKDAEVPVTWSQVATDIIVSKYFRKAGVPQTGADRTPLLDGDGHQIRGAEQSAKQVFDRLAGTWRHWGERFGYFASTEDGDAFEDELKYMLAHQMGSPNSPQWFNTGLNWAYGLTGPAQGFWFVDPETGEAVPSPDAYSRPSPHACYILSVDDDLVNEGGIMDLWLREARIFKFGSGVGENFSSIRAEGEPLSGGGKSSGLMSFLKIGDRAAGAIKCLHEAAEIPTERGLLPIRDIRHGDRVLTRRGYEEVAAVHDNGIRELVRVTTALGDEVLCTPEHRFWVRTPTGEQWRQAGRLHEDDFLVLDVSASFLGARQDLRPVEPGHHNERQHQLPGYLDEATALWLGWVYGDGSITTRPSAKFIAVQIGDADPELIARYRSLVCSIFGADAHVYVNRPQARDDRSASVRFASSQVIRFLEVNGLRKAHSSEVSVPGAVRSSPAAVRAAFLSGLFEADGHIDNGYPVLSTVSRQLALDVHRLLLGLGIPSIIKEQRDRRAALGNAPVFLVRVIGGLGVYRFSKLVGFISERKSMLLAEAVERKGLSPFETQWFLPHVKEALNDLWVSSTGRLRRALAPYCRYRSPRSMSLLRARRLIDEFPDELKETVLAAFARGDRMYVRARVSPAPSGRVFDLTVAGVHEYLVHCLVTHNSGGTTRRAAKMVILDVDHPDIEAFVDWKKVEEEKARILIEHGGFPADFNGEAYQTVSGQNSNNSVRVPNEFVAAVLQDEEWDLIERTTGKVRKSIKARQLWTRIAEAAWACADPGVQFDTTINEWHTSPAGGRIRATNPCSEYVYLDNTACNLASLNLVSFFDDQTGTFDVEAYRHAIRLWTIVLEIAVTMAHFPSKAVAEGSYLYRTLGLGYANLGSLLMRSGIPYDSEEGRAVAGCLTAILTGEAYAASAEMAAALGPFAKFPENREAMLRVVRNHRRAAYDALESDYEGISHQVMGIDEQQAPETLLKAAREAWDRALELGERHGYRNAQVSVIAPTGCLVGGSLIPTERGLVRLRSLGDVHGPPWQRLDIDIATDQGTRQASHFFVNGPEPVVAVQTRRGYRIQGTPAHRIKIVQQDGSWTWRRFADIAPGDLVPLALSQLIGSPQHVPLPPLPDAYWTSDHRTTVPRSMTADLAELVGYFMGDGSLHSRGIRLCVASQDFDVVERLCQQGKELFGLEAKVSQKTGYREVAFNSVRLVQWWEACGFAKEPPTEGHSGKGYRPRIPDAVLHSNDPEVYRAFVRGLYEAHGTVHRGYPSWSTTSLEFSYDVQGLLLTLGFPTTRKLDTTGWGGSQLAVLRLHNLGYTGAWTREIGFIGGRKQAALVVSGTPQASTRDYIPVPRAMIDRLAPDNDSLRKTMLMSHRRRPGMVSRRSAVELLRRTGDPHLDRLLRFVYDQVSTSDQGEEQLTYDLSVPDNVTYLANGFVSHNTIGLQMDCDTTGVEPDFALVKFKKLAGGGYFKIVNQSVAPALARLGYTADQIEDIVDYVVGTMTLLGTPHVNRQSLTGLGFAPDELRKVEEVLPAVFELRHAFSPFVLGSETLERLGFKEEQYASFEFDLLRELGFSAAQVREATDVICGRQTIEGAPHLLEEHLAVFDTANRNGRLGRRFIHHSGHIRMMAVVQPFITGAISKTINMPNEVTVEDIKGAYMMSWELGLKCMALYRDGSKASQPLSAVGDEGSTVEEQAEIDAALEPSRALAWGEIPAGISPTQAYASGMKPPRFLLPSRRGGWTQEARIGGHKVFLRTGEYADGTLGELFIDLAKEGATLRGVLSCFAIAVSKGLQYGVPLEEFIDTFTFQTFEPRGLVEGHPNIKMANSIVDYIFRVLALEYVGRTDLVQVPPTEGDFPEPPSGLAVDAGTQLDLTEAAMEADIEVQRRAADFVDAHGTRVPEPKVTPQPVRAGLARDAGSVSVQQALADLMGDAPLCDICGHITIRNGSCFKCLNCGNSLGCS